MRSGSTLATSLFAGHGIFMHHDHTASLAWEHMWEESRRGRCIVIATVRNPFAQWASLAYMRIVELGKAAFTPGSVATNGTLLAAISTFLRNGLQHCNCSLPLHMRRTKYGPKLRAFNRCSFDKKRYEFCNTAFWSKNFNAVTGHDVLRVAPEIRQTGHALLRERPPQKPCSALVLRYEDHDRWVGWVCDALRELDRDFVCHFDAERTHHQRISAADDVLNNYNWSDSELQLGISSEHMHFYTPAERLGFLSQLTSPAAKHAMKMSMPT